MTSNDFMVICPKCEMEMEEDEEDYEDMTEGQQANYDAGFSHSFSCSECGHHLIYDAQIPMYNEEPWEDEEIDELVEITRINPDSFEEVIENALIKKCFIEATSLIHNVIEVYLKRKLNDFFSTDKERLDYLNHKNQTKYLKDYNSLCYLFAIIDKKMYLKITQFNKDRNKAMHDLLKEEVTVEELRQVARRGRELQMILSPLNHTPLEIIGIMKVFDSITK